MKLQERTNLIVNRLENEEFRIEKNGSTGTAVRTMIELGVNIDGEVFRIETEEKVWYGSQHIDYSYELKSDGEVYERFKDFYMGDDVEYFFNETLMKKKGIVNLSEKILTNKEIKRNIMNNCELYESIDDAIEKTLNKNTNGTTVEVVEKGEKVEFDCCLHISDAKEILLESRSFTEDGGEMIGAYLEVLDENLNIKELVDYDDCIWEYTNWKKL